MSIIVWELILVAAVALGLGAWQLHDVNRALRDDGEEESSGAAGSRKCDGRDRNDDRRNGD